MDNYRYLVLEIAFDDDDSGVHDLNVVFRSDYYTECQDIAYDMSRRNGFEYQVWSNTSYNECKGAFCCRYVNGIMEW